MTLEQRYRVTCDARPCRHKGPAARSRIDALAAARRLGWQERGGGWVCPGCAYQTRLIEKGA
jgi:hypothetical protein